MNTSMHNKSGDISRYGFACGCIEEKCTTTGVCVTMWYEHETYHIRGNDLTNLKRLFWHSTRSLTEARKLFKKETHNS